MLQPPTPGETSPQQLSITADSLACPPLPRVKKDTATYSQSDEIFVKKQRGGEMETVSFQISNSVAEITGLPKDEESSAFQIRLTLDIQSCQLKKLRGFDGCLTMIWSILTRMQERYTVHGHPGRAWLCTKTAAHAHFDIESINYMDWCESGWSCTGNAKNHFHPLLLVPHIIWD